jgi:NAD(P)-dependent dehydrogenase (short-subunit alcohol dehydrogenase family)
VAEGLADVGAMVTCADLQLANAEATAATIRDKGGRAEAHVVDIRDEAGVEALIGGMPGLDVLVCTPAVNVRKPLLSLTGDEFDRVVGLNLKGSFLVMRAAGRRMADAGRGSIVFFSSIRAQTVEPGQGVYAATKAGTLQLIRALAAELGPRGVRANAIAPGVVETPLTARSRRTPTGTAPTPPSRRSVAGPSRARWWVPAIYLASDASSFVTGTLTLVDGGWTAVDGRFSRGAPL